MDEVIYEEFKEAGNQELRLGAKDCCENASILQSISALRRAEKNC